MDLRGDCEAGGADSGDTVRKEEVALAASFFVRWGEQMGLAACPRASFAAGSGIWCCGLWTRHGMKRGCIGPHRHRPCIGLIGPPPIGNQSEGC